MYNIRNAITLDLHSSIIIFVIEIITVSGLAVARPIPVTVIVLGI